MMMNELYHSLFMVGTSALILFFFFILVVVLQAERRRQEIDKKIKNLLKNNPDYDNSCSNMLIYTNKGKIKNVKVDSP